MQFLLLLSFVSCSLGSKEAVVWLSAYLGCFQHTCAVLGNAGCQSAGPCWVGTMELAAWNQPVMQSQVNYEKKHMIPTTDCLISTPMTLWLFPCQLTAKIKIFGHFFQCGDWLTCRLISDIRNYLMVFRSEIMSFIYSQLWNVCNSSWTLYASLPDLNYAASSIFCAAKLSTAGSTGVCKYWESGSTVIKTISVSIVFKSNLRMFHALYIHDISSFCSESVKYWSAPVPVCE